MTLTRITQGVIKPNQNYDTHNINSTGIVTATGLNISGNASIGGVLTYEDVTNIDSVGIITARSGVRVNADGSTSSNYMSVGASDDLKIYHDSNDSYINNTGTGVLYLNGSTVNLKHSGGIKLYTDISGVGVLGNVDATGFLSGGDGIRLPLVGGVGITTIEKGQASFTGIVTASSFSGDGSALTGINAGGLTIGNNANTYSNNSFSNITSNSQYNTIIGWNAGNAISTGDQNTIYGYRAGGVHNNSQETIIGANCFSERGSHTYAVGLGYGAGMWNEGDYNTAIGYESVGAHLNSDGNNNTGLGFQALRAIRSGSNNVALGFQADNTATTGSNRIVIGANADASAVDVSNEITLGDSNINHLRIPGIGVSFTPSGGIVSGALTCTTIMNKVDHTSENTVIIGIEAADLNTNNDNCVFIGYKAGYKNATGTSSNIFIGTNAGGGYGGTVGSQNVMIGAGCGTFMYGGANYNTAVGQGAGHYNNKSYCVSIGGHAGASRGEYNTAIGGRANGEGHQMDTNYMTYPNNTSSTQWGDNNICIGYQSNTPHSDADNYIVIGNSKNTNFVVGTLGFEVTAGVTTNTGSVVVGAGISAVGILTATGGVHDNIGNLRSVPQSTTSSNIVVQQSHRGKHILHSGTGGWTINTGTGFSPGDMVTFVNNTASAQTLFQASGVTLYDTTDGATGDHSIKERGIATAICTATHVYYISGTIA